MIDLTQIRAPGWEQVVRELTAPAPDDETFLKKLTAVLGQVSGARQASLLAVASGADDQQPRALFVWPTAGAELEQGEAVRTAVRSASSASSMRVFGLDKEELFYNTGPSKGYVVALPLTASESDVGGRLVVALLLDHRSRQALQTTLAMIEVLAGFVHAHAARQQLRRTRAASAALDLAARLISSVNGAKGFKGAAFQVVNDLVRQTGADRAAVGWAHSVGSSGAIRLVALSDTEHVDRRTNLVQKLEAAMDECLDQEQAVVYPPPPASGEGSDALLAMAITHAHRELAAADARLKVASVPLRVDDDVVGVVTIESTGDGVISLPTIELLQATMDLIAPLLKLRRSDDRILAARAWDSCVRAAAWAVGPKHTVWKVVGVLVLALVLTVTFVRIEYRVEAPMEVLPLEERIISMPFDGVIAEVPEAIKPGAEVRQGDVLVRLDTDLLELRRLDAVDKLRLYQAQADAARDEGDAFKEQQAQAQAGQAEASIRLYDEQIARSTIRAPIDGTIIEGDLTARVGSTLKLGEPLFKVARTDRMIVEAKVRDEDIRRVFAEIDRDGSGAGRIIFQSDPSTAFPVTIDRIVPLARPEEGTNSFVVRARFENVPDGIAPGMEGVARFDTGRERIIYVLTRRIIDRIRLWTFW